MDNEQQEKRVRYVKPEVLDLGPVTAAVGGTCNPMGAIPTGKSPCGAPGSWVAICQFGQNGGLTLKISP